LAKLKIEWGRQVSKLKIPHLILAIAILVANCVFAVSEADAATYTVSQNSGLLTRMCGQNITGCVWCVNSSGHCYRVTGCSSGTCTIERFIAPKGGVNGGTVKPDKPVQAPPPPKSSGPTNAAPIVNGKPVQTQPPSSGKAGPTSPIDVRPIGAAPGGGGGRLK
jgi:hypothetical protein